MPKDKIYNIDQAGIKIRARFGVDIPDLRTVKDFSYHRKFEQTLRQKAIQVQNNVDVICDILELVDKIEKEL